MFTNIFDNRNKKISNILRLSDSLSRSLRKGLEIFDISDNKVTFLSEDEKLIEGTLDSDTVTFRDITITDGEVIRNPKKFDSLIESKVSNLILNLLQNDYPTASEEFNTILECWEHQTKYGRIKTKLENKITKLLSNSKIIESEEFKKLEEVKENLITFLKENSEKISKVEQIINSYLLSKKISEAFNFPKMSYENLSEAAEYVVNKHEYLTTYDMIFRQELIKRELLESKENMEGIWASNDLFKALAEGIFDETEEQITENLFNLVREIPYFALASKSQIYEIFDRYSSLKNEFASPKELKEYSSRIFELKKPLREQLINILNEKYGINLQNLKDPPSFKTLIKAQISIFEAITKLAPKSVLKDVLKEFTAFYKNCQGVESVDVNDLLTEVFQKGIGLNESSILNYIDLSRVADDLQKFSMVLKQVQGQAGGMGQPGVTPTPGSPMQAPPVTASPGAMATPGAMPNPAKHDQQYPSDETLSPQQTAVNQAKTEMDSELAANGQLGTNTGEVPPEMAEPESMGQDQLVQQLNALDSILQDLSFELKRGIGGDGSAPPGGELEGDLPPEEGLENTEGEMEFPEGESAPTEDGEPNSEESPEESPEEFEVEEKDTPPEPKAKSKPAKKSTK